MDLSAVPHLDKYFDEFMLHNWKVLLGSGVILRGIAQALKWNWVIAILDSFRAGIGAARDQKPRPLSLPFKKKKTQTQTKGKSK